MHERQIGIISISLGLTYKHIKQRKKNSPSAGITNLGLVRQYFSPDRKDTLAAGGNETKGHKEQ